MHCSRRWTTCWDYTLEWKVVFGLSAASKRTLLTERTLWTLANFGFLTPRCTDHWRDTGLAGYQTSNCYVYGCVLSWRSAADHIILAFFDLTETAHISGQTDKRDIYTHIACVIGTSAFQG